MREHLRNGGRQCNCYLLRGRGRRSVIHDGRRGVDIETGGVVPLFKELAICDVDGIGAVVVADIEHIVGFAEVACGSTWIVQRKIVFGLLV